MDMVSPEMTLESVPVHTVTTDALSNPFCRLEEGVTPMRTLSMHPTEGEDWM